jgi:ElaB/YqjD/DUF883 family membrane-anchored ribosome-binding protein
MFDVRAASGSSAFLTGEQVMADNMAEAGSRMGNDAGSTVSNVAGKAREMAGQYADQAKEYAQQGYEYAADKTKQLKETTQGYIEENPWYAIGIALGVGVLLGLMLRGGRD